MSHKVEYYKMSKRKKIQIAENGSLLSEIQSDLAFVILVWSMAIHLPLPDLNLSLGHTIAEYLCLISKLCES